MNGTYGVDTALNGYREADGGKSQQGKGQEGCDVCV